MATWDGARFHPLSYQGSESLGPTPLEIPKHVPPWEIKPTPSIDLCTSLGLNAPRACTSESFDMAVDCVEIFDDSLEEVDVTLVV